MDCFVPQDPYNMERVFWLLSNKDGALVKKMMEEFQLTHAHTLPDNLRKQVTVHCVGLCRFVVIQVILSKMSESNQGQLNMFSKDVDERWNVFGKISPVALEVRTLDVHWGLTWGSDVQSGHSLQLLSLPICWNVQLCEVLSSGSVSDEGILKTMRRCWEENRYLLCPHSAVAVWHHYNCPHSPALNRYNHQHITVTVSKRLRILDSFSLFFFFFLVVPGATLRLRHQLSFRGRWTERGWLSTCLRRWGCWTS